MVLGFLPLSSRRHEQDDLQQNELERGQRLFGDPRMPILQLTGEVACAKCSRVDDLTHVHVKAEMYAVSTVEN
jgi:hypothetical protein